MRRLAFIFAALLAATPAFAAARLSYPDAPRDPKPDTYFGTTVPDPYRWLENVDSPQTQAWVRAEGDLTRSYLDAVPQRGAIKNAFRKLLDYEKIGAPFREGQRWFFTRNSGLQNQSVLYVRDAERAPARVFPVLSPISSAPSSSMERPACAPRPRDAGGSALTDG